MSTVSQNRPEGTPLNVESAVRARYADAAQAVEPNLCCAVNYDQSYLQAIPQEIIERDYGCGDPSTYLQPGETVLDLGSGGGKICYIASQVVGSNGHVIGVDFNETMLELAQKYRQEVAEKIGYSNVEFRKGRIQDLQLDLALFDTYLQENPIVGSGDWLRAEEYARELRQTSPLVEDDSIDVVVSNCVLNLVRNEDRRQMFAEIHRVLKRGGRAVISDIVADEDVPVHLQQNADLWSGCMSGAFREDAFLKAFEEAGFYGVEILSRQNEPWAVVEGIEFRSLTVRAYQGKAGPCLDRHQAVIYQGPWKAVIDDDGHKLLRGERMAVCEKTFEMYTQAPYADCITPIIPAKEVPLSEATDFDCDMGQLRDPRETKASSTELNVLPGDCCGTTDCC